MTQTDAIQGHATRKGTGAYRERFKPVFDSSHFREKHDLWQSSIGLGTYLGEPDEGTDNFYAEAIAKALLSGINVIDTAANYRAQRSERVIGRVLKEMTAAGTIKREEIILSTKGGFLPFDGSYPDDAEAYIQKNFVESGLLSDKDIIQGCHAMTPEYLEYQLNCSLKNLGVAAVDVYYLHNPETQLGTCSRSDFMEKIRRAFKWLEEKTAEGKIKRYGAATWNGFRVPQTNREYLALHELMVLAREVGGPGNHFSVIQLPLNLAMPEGWILSNQSYGAHQVSVAALAEKSNMAVVSSGTLLQSRLAGPLPEVIAGKFPDLETSAQKAIQFTRSIPGVTTALVGMKNHAHVSENLKTAQVPAISSDVLIRMFQDANT